MLHSPWPALRRFDDHRQIEIAGQMRSLCRRMAESMAAAGHGSADNLRIRLGFTKLLRSVFKRITTLGDRLKHQIFFFRCAEFQSVCCTRPTTAAQPMAVGKYRRCTSRIQPEDCRGNTPFAAPSCLVALLLIVLQKQQQHIPYYQRCGHQLLFASGTAYRAAKSNWSQLATTPYLQQVHQQDYAHRTKRREPLHMGP